MINNDSDDDIICPDNYDDFDVVSKYDANDDTRSLQASNINNDL